MEQVAFNLIAPDCPAWRGHAAEQFKTRPGTSLLDHVPDLLRLGTMLIAVEFSPAFQVVCTETSWLALDGKDKEFVGDAPAVADSDFRFAPDEHALIGEPPGLEDARAVKEKSVRRPQVQVTAGCG